MVFAAGWARSPKSTMATWYQTKERPGRVAGWKKERKEKEKEKKKINGKI